MKFHEVNSAQSAISSSLLIKLLVFVIGCMAFSIRAQILVGDGTYSQNFDSLATNGTSNPWTDDSTLAGWYASKTAGGTMITTYRATNGMSTAGALYGFGATASTERALGTIASSTPDSLSFGVRFANDTASALTNIAVSYTGEQWRSGSTANPQTLEFSYQVSGGAFSNSFSGTWVRFSALDFVSPNLSGSSSALDGNAPDNRTLLTNVVLTGVTVAPGEELFLRWTDVDDTGFDNGLAIDDLTVSFGEASDPEPPPAPSTNLLTLLQYNVKGNGTTDWSTNTAQVQAIGRVLTYLNPDIITFNEIPFTNTWQMTNWVKAFLSGYNIATNSGTDGFIRSVIASRFPITRSTKWLDGADLNAFGYTNANPALDNFTRDLFEAEIAVPGFPQRLHVFATHLKAGGTSDDVERRAAEAAAITNFFATNLFVHYPLAPYLLAGDMNTSDTNSLAIQRLISAPTGLRLTNPKNPQTGSINTFSIQGTLNNRLDYIFPGPLLVSNVRTSEVFRSDMVSPLPAGLNAGDNATASDHLPVLMVFNNPYDQPVQIASIIRSNQSLSLTWNSVIGQPYSVESSSNLTAWTTFATNLTAVSDVITLMTNSSEGVNYFRVVRLP